MGDVTVFLDEMEAHDLGYTTSMNRQMALVLDTFYCELKRCGVSSMTGAGLQQMHTLIQAARLEYFEVYVKDVLMAQQTAELGDEAHEDNQSVFIGQFDHEEDEEEQEEEGEQMATGDNVLGADLLG